MSKLIVDGYNLLHSSPRYAASLERDIDAARERLIADFGARAAEGDDVVIVFDGGGNAHSDGHPHLVGGVTVVFSPAGETADAIVEQLAARAREAGEQAVVVTSDAATRWSSLGGTVTVMRAPSFARELEADEREWREVERGPRSHSTLGDRIDPAVRRALDRLAGRGDRPSD